MHVIDVMAMVMEVFAIVIDLRCNACDRCDDDGDEHCDRTIDVWHMIEVMATVMEIVKGFKL